MRKRKIASLAFTGVAGVGMAAYGTAPALAAGGTWTVNHTGTFKGSGTGAIGSWTCTKVTIAGKITSSTAADSKPVASITSLTFKSCTGFGATINAKLKKTAYLFASGATTSNGLTKGYLAGRTGKAADAVSFNMSGSTLGAHCTAKIAGESVPTSYSNTGHKLLINTGKTKTLTITSPKSCTGIADGSKTYASARLTIKSPKSTVITNT